MATFITTAVRASNLMQELRLVWGVLSIATKIATKTKNKKKIKNCCD
jgi:hypothetical protein